LGQIVYKSLFASIALFTVTVSALAADRVAPPGEQALRVAAFDNWEVRKGLFDNSYLLIGRSREQDGYFWLNCDPNGFVNVAVPINEKTGLERLRSFPITIWSDGHGRHELSLIVFENFVAVALDYEGGRNDKLATFLDVLQTSKQTFTISYGGRIFDFDTAKLPTAQTRFTELCRQRPARAVTAAR